MTLEEAYRRLNLAPPLNYEAVESQKVIDRYGNDGGGRRIGTTVHLSIEYVLDSLQQEGLGTSVPTKFLVVGADNGAYMREFLRDLCRIYETLGGKNPRTKGPHKGLPRAMRPIMARDVRRAIQGRLPDAKDIYFDPCGIDIITGPQRLIRRIDHDPRADFDTFKAMDRDANTICEMTYEQVQTFLASTYMPVEIGVQGRVMETKLAGLARRFL